MSIRGLIICSHWTKINLKDMRDKIAKEGDTFTIDDYEPSNKQGTSRAVSEAIIKGIMDAGLTNPLITSLCEK